VYRSVRGIFEGVVIEFCGWLVGWFSAITSLYGLDSNTRSIIIQLCFELGLSLVLTKNPSP